MRGHVAVLTCPLYFQDTVYRKLQYTVYVYLLFRNLCPNKAFPGLYLQHLGLVLRL